LKNIKKIQGPSLPSFAEKINQKNLLPKLFELNVFKIIETFEKLLTKIPQSDNPIKPLQTLHYPSCSTYLSV